MSFSILKGRDPYHPDSTPDYNFMIYFSLNPNKNIIEAFLLGSGL